MLDRDQAGWRGRNLVQVDGKVSAAGDGAGGQDRLQDLTTGCRGGDRDRVCHSCNMSPLGGTLTRVRLGVSPH